jgi:DNA-directed RNA polymerase specialized sigma subunit
MAQAPARKRAKNPTTSEATVKYYLTNSELLPEVIKAKQLNRMTDELAVMLMKLCRKYAQRPSFSGYTYKEDMISEALANLCQNALKFNTEKYDNPFAYYTSCINNSFLHFLIAEKKHRRIRDQLLVDIGESPSYSFIEEMKNHKNEGGEFSVELDDLKGQIEEAKHRIIKEDADKVIRDAENAAEKAAKLEAVEELIEVGSFLDFGEEPQPEGI